MTTDSSALDQLEKLFALKKAGVLTDAEFEAEKARVLRVGRPESRERPDASDNLEATDPIGIATEHRRYFATTSAKAIAVLVLFLTVGLLAWQAARNDWFKLFGAQDSQISTSPAAESAEAASPIVIIDQSNNPYNEGGEGYEGDGDIPATGIIHDLIIDDDLLKYANRGGEEAQNFCYGDTVRIKNQSTKDVRLFVGQDGLPERIDQGMTPSGKALELSAFPLGEMLISGTTGKGLPDLDFYRYEVRDCD